MESLVVRMRRHWWVVALRGVLALLLALVALARPFATVAALMWCAGVFFFVDGIVSAVAGVRALRANDQWGWLVFEGVLGVCAGVLAFVMPVVTAMAFVIVTAAWALLTGSVMILAAVRLRREIESEWALGLAGVASVVLGLALAAWPAAGVVVWSWMLGGYALVTGVALLALALRVRMLPIADLAEGQSFDVPLPAAVDPTMVRTTVVGRVVRIVVPRGGLRGSAP